MKWGFYLSGVAVLAGITWYSSHQPQPEVTSEESKQILITDIPKVTETKAEPVFTDIPKIDPHTCTGCAHHEEHDLAKAHLIAEHKRETWPIVATDYIKEKFKASPETINHVTRSISHTEFEQLTEEQLTRVVNYATSVQGLTLEELIFLCWAPDTPKAFQQAMDNVRALAVTEASETEPLPVFQANARWTRTATDGFNITEGQPVTITWGIVPDGTNIASTASFPGSTSNLLETLNDTYGTAPPNGDPIQDAPWFELFETAFNFWAEATGNVYVYESNDDGPTVGGAAGFTSAGFVGIRPDVRIAGMTLDGGSGTLAFNFFPNSGNMVIDTADSSNFTNSTFIKTLFRNVIAHEHGHGLGFSHVCPINQSKLMEPFASAAFIGPQFDDIITAQGVYGDPSERNENIRNNDTISNATDLDTITSSFENENLAITDSGDVDIFRFSVESPSQLTLRVAPTTESPYLEGPQLSTGPCTSGTLFDPSNRQNLSIRILDTNGFTVLASSNSQGIGNEEIITDLELPLAEVDYFIEVSGGGENSSDNNHAQVYSLEISISEVLPDLSIAAVDNTATEQNTSNTGTFTITSSLAPSSNLNVPYTITGNATPGSDFAALSGSATITSGQLSVSIPVTPITDSQIEGDENVIVTISPSASYTIGTSSASVTIFDLPFDDFRHTFFGANSVNIGETDDFDGDGIQNLIEFALGLDPTSPNPQTQPFAQLSNNGAELQLVYQENTELTDIEYIVEVSPTLGVAPNLWTTEGVTITTGPSINGIRTVTASTTANVSRQFMRLRIDRNP